MDKEKILEAVEAAERKIVRVAIAIVAGIIWASFFFGEA